MSRGPARLILAASLGLASIALTALNADPASANVTSPPTSAHSSTGSLSPRLATPGTWNNAIEIPGTATLNIGLNAGAASISCSSSGNCSAGGSYADASGDSQAFVVNETGGTWGTAIEVPGLAPLNAGGDAAVFSISCSSAGNCGAGGYYTDGLGDTDGFLVNETGGTWGIATEVIDPSAIASSDALGVESISCTAAGSCSATGDDVIAGGDSVGFAVSETGGAWSDANEITISTTFGTGGTSLDYVSCSSPGNCSAAGNGVYTDAAVSGGQANIPFTVEETNGTWGAPSFFPGLATLNVGLDSTSTTISCSSAGNCSAGGNYYDATDNSQAFVASETNGTWGNAVEMPGSAALNVGGVASLFSLSCTSSGDCGGTGVYADASALAQDFVVNETNGTWGNATAIPGASSLFVNGTGTVPNVISCSSAGNCSAAGFYVDDVGSQAFVVNEKNGSWGDVIEIPGTGLLNVGDVADTVSISCSADSSCGAGGFYGVGTDQYQAFVTDMAPLFATQATLTITSTEGKIGAALPLTTSGGSGTGLVTFSVVNGTALGCAVSGTSLQATSPGTCLVTATKAGDTNYLAATATTSVAMALPARPGPVSVGFAAKSSALSAAARSALTTLSKKLLKGASITVTGIAKGNARLAKSRASVVAQFLSGKDQTHASIRTNTSAAANKATVVTTKQ